MEKNKERIYTSKSKYISTENLKKKQKTNFRKK